MVKWESLASTAVSVIYIYWKPTLYFMYVEVSVKVSVYLGLWVGYCISYLHGKVGIVSYAMGINLRLIFGCFFEINEHVLHQIPRSFVLSLLTRTKHEWKYKLVANGLCFKSLLL